MEPEAAADKHQFIRDEFECFVRIGLDAHLRRKVQRMLESRLVVNASFLLPTMYFETRDNEGNIVEMWYVEPDSNQLLRLLNFLHRFTIEDVRLIDSMLHTQ
jgi:hypothetical protein